MLLLVLLLLLLLLLVVLLLLDLPVVVLAAVVQYNTCCQPGRRHEGVWGGDSVLVEKGLAAEDVTMFLSVVRVTAGHVSLAGGFRRAASLAA